MLDQELLSLKEYFFAKLGIFSHLILRISQNRQYFLYYDLSHLTMGYLGKKHNRGGGVEGGFNHPIPLLLPSEYLVFLPLLETPQNIVITPLGDFKA